MKKLILIAAFVGASVLTVFASTQYVFTPINLIVKFYNPQFELPTLPPRVPTNTPEVYLEGHTILFHSDNLCDFIVIVDPENDTTFAYYTAMPVGTDHIELPSYLHGEYEIRFCKESYYYSGTIILQ